MKYISTRGGGEVSPSAAIINGIAGDGGLYVPEAIPRLDIDYDVLKGLDYKALALKILSLYFTDFTETELKACLAGAYNDNFDTPLIAPLVQKGKVSFLELFHGKTLAFKDMALSLLPYLLKVAAEKNGVSKEILILTATSGDTGKAALEGFKDIPGIKIIVFYPKDGVSVMQSLQMLTQEGDNTHVAAVNGNFDDAQSGVKDIFNDKEFAKRLSDSNIILSSANSINIGRLIPQIVYYYYAYAQLLKNGLNPGEKISFVVPTGNFGNILAGYYAKLMGLPINKLICASNDNKVLYDFFNSGEFNINRKFMSTITPSMDIILPSNFERFIYSVLDSSESLNQRLASLKNDGSYTANANKTDIIGFYSTENETREAIKRVWEKYAYIIDPHTAVAYAAYEKYQGSERTVIVSTASPYKFTKTVMSSIDPKYQSSDDFQLIGKMAELRNDTAPESITSLNKKKILHSGSADKDNLKSVVLDILGM